MKKASYLLIAIIWLMSPSLGSAQDMPADFKKLNIGDTIPDLYIENVLIPNKEGIEIRELYESGMLLIDFWATWCVPCIHQLIRLDTLKKQFPNFKSISVTYQDEAVVKTFFESEANSDVRSDHLIVVPNDTVLRKLFPHRSIPHNVWVDRNGVVKAITGGSLVTADRVEQFLENQSFTDTKDVLKQDIMRFDPKKPFTLGDTIYKYRSIVTPYINGLNSGSIVDNQYHDKRRFFAHNLNAVHLYWQAFGNFKPVFKSNLIDVITTDSLKFYSPANSTSGNFAHLLETSKYANYTAWERENLHCYELTLPRYVPDSVFSSYIIEDLDRYFNCKSSVVEEIMPCVVFRADSIDEVYIAPATLDSPPYVVFRYPKLVATNITMDILIDYLMATYAYVKEPLINQVNYSQCFDMEIDFTDLIGADNLGKKGISFSMVATKLAELGIEMKKEDLPYKKLIVVDLNK